MSTALQQLENAYRNRHDTARRWHAEGRLVIGYVGADVPVELITATGALPVRLFGDPAADTGPGDRYLGRGLDQAARSILTQLVQGHHRHIHAVVVSRDCEASLRLFYALRELRRVEADLPLPEVALLDLLHLPHRTTARYDLAKVGQLREHLRRWTGQPLDDTDLETAIEQHGQGRELLAEIAALRREPEARLTGTQALAVTGAGTCLPATDYTALLQTLLAEASTLPPVGGLRTFLTGSSHDHPGVYAQLEAAGLLVVGEDHDWGDLAFERRVEHPTLLGLAERYQYNGPTAQRSSISDRAAYTDLAADRSRAQALLSYVREHDDAPPWDFPAQQDAVARRGLPAVLVERQPYGRLDDDALAQAVDTLTRTPVGVTP